MANATRSIQPMQRWIRHLLMVLVSAGSLGTSPCAHAIPTIYGWGGQDGVPPHKLESLEGVVAISLGGRLKLKSDGTVWTGLNGTSDPVPILNHVVAISSLTSNRTMALQSDGTVWMWGDIRIAPPMLVEGLTNVTAIATSYGYSLALKSDGTVWAWGRNDSGQLGIGSESQGDHPTPVRVTGLSDVVAISAGVGHSLALKSDGTIWKWGDHVTTPQPVPLLTGVTAIAAGLQHDLALTADGSVWAWGTNHYGQLGNGTTSDAESPTPSRIQNLSNVVQISSYFDSNLALKDDGTVWGWGREYTQWDHNFDQAVPTPRRVLDLPPVRAIVAGGEDWFDRFLDVALTEPLEAASDHTPPETISSTFPTGPYPDFPGLSPFSADYSAWEDRPYRATDVALIATDQGSGVRSLTYSATGTDPVAETTVNKNSAILHLLHAGETTITYSATDEAGNVEPKKSVTVRVKTSPPVLTVSKPPTLTGFQTLHFTVTSDQPLSEPPKYGYVVDYDLTYNESNLPPIELNGTTQPTGEPNVYSFTFYPSSREGYYTLYISGKDVAGNFGEASVSFSVDVRLPTIGATLTGTESGPNWFTSDVSLFMMAEIGFVPNYVIPFNGYYSLDDPGCSPETLQGCVQISGPYTVNISSEGSHTLYYFARKVDGLASPLQTLTFTINKTGPVAQSQSLTLQENHPVEITLQSSDAVVKKLSYSIVSPPSHGTLGAINGDRVTYTPNPGYHGPDSFTFQASDGDFLGTVGSVDLTVSPASANGGGPSGSQGDVTGDAVVDLRDAVWLVQAVAGLQTLTPEERAVADINCDGSVDVGDAVQLLRSLAFGQSLPACQ